MIFCVLFFQLDLKLWVNTVNTVTALTQDTPVVLTDSVCLIPGGEPVVRLEDAPGNARREAQQMGRLWCRNHTNRDL